MSYIRSTSNPEGLCVHGEWRGRVRVAHTVKRPLSSGRNFPVPERSFERACAMWDRYRDDASADVVAR